MQAALVVASRLERGVASPAPSGFPSGHLRCPLSVHHQDAPRSNRFRVPVPAAMYPRRWRGRSRGRETLLQISHPPALLASPTCRRVVQRGQHRSNRSIVDAVICLPFASPSQRASIQLIEHREFEWRDFQRSLWPDSCPLQGQHLSLPRLCCGPIVGQPRIVVTRGFEFPPGVSQVSFGTFRRSAHMPNPCHPCLQQSRLRAESNPSRCCGLTDQR